jgi:adenosylhomocysteine nucleosidase
VSSLLVVVAVDAEARTLARHLGLPAVTGSLFAHYRGGILEVAAVGLRARALDDRVSRCRVPSLVISSGVCGALAPALAQGDLVVPERVIDARGGAWLTSAVPPLARRGTLLCADGIAGSAAAKSRLWMETAAVAVDMESAPILAWARARGLEATVVRGVSDTASEAVPSDLAAVVGEDGRTRPMRAVHAALTRPGALADALTLRRGMQAALAAVAGALATLARRLPVAR